MGPTIDCWISLTIYITTINNITAIAHWAETDYGLSAGQYAVFPKDKGNI